MLFLPQNKHNCDYDSQNKILELLCVYFLRFASEASDVFHKNLSVFAFESLESVQPKSSWNKTSFRGGEGVSDLAVLTVF